MFINEIRNLTSECECGILSQFSRVYSTGLYPPIPPKDTYVVEFSKELSIPSGTSVIISPSGYSISKVNEFTPECSVQLISEYLSGNQTVIKVDIKDIYNKVLYSEYKKIVCSPQNTTIDPCVRIDDTEASQSLDIELNERNNWEYKYNGFLIVKFIPNNLSSIIKLVFNKKSSAVLPVKSSTDDAIKINLNVQSMQEKNITTDMIRTAIYINSAQWDSYNNANTYNLTTAANTLSLDSIDSRTPEQIRNILIIERSITNTGGASTVEKIYIKDVADVYYLEPTPAKIPTVSIMKYKNNNSSTLNKFGEIQYNSDVYGIDDNITVTIDNKTYIGSYNDIVTVVSEVV